MSALSRRKSMLPNLANQWLRNCIAAGDDLYRKKCTLTYTLDQKQTIALTNEHVIGRFAQLQVNAAAEIEVHQPVRLWQ